MMNNFQKLFSIFLDKVDTIQSIKKKCCTKGIENIYISNLKYIKNWPKIEVLA